ncbi:chemotaxis protein [Paramagnetospirillum kuznetsovii]|uniref:Chemotaxis protein n=1 Tax=Paramagnetospirillum kuznetsovii TaxID=2053833 RepID=A0A364NWR6_9PROT|nr:chemotaxis protein CheW [Paramagnetospirillum kuznetsovii]RAU21534.1 chemotaxis protein [Paramagnetospirillum kuznetsovii]
MTSQGGTTRDASVMERLHARIEWAESENDNAFNSALLKARALRLARPRGALADVPTGLDALICTIGAERYAVPLTYLSEVMPLGNWTPVPGQPQYLLGVTNLRGEIRPVIDLHSLLGLEPLATAGRGWVIFIRADGAEIGLRVDGVERIAGLDGSKLTKPHETGNGLPQRFVAGISPETLILLDIAQILALDVLNDSKADARRAS